VQWLRSLLFYLGLAAVTIVFVPVCLVIRPLPYPLRFRIVSRWAAFNLWWLGVTCGLRHEVQGQENIPPGPAIILCKHQSAWETLALQLVFPPQIWVLKRELLRIPIYGWGLALMEPIAIDRAAGRRALRTIVSEGKERLGRGLWVVVFPEGTRVAPGHRRRWGMGGAVLAAATGVPVVPVAHDAGHYWRRRGFFKRPGTIRLVIGPPIETRGRRAEDILREAEDWVNRTVERLEQGDA
jgi:1-acyl-sn-glycerol-3-phosphate acyltransferase